MQNNKLRSQIKEYLEWKGSYAPSAFKAYNSPLSKLKKLDSLEDVHRYNRLLAESCAPATISFSISVVRDFVNFLWYRKETEINPNLIKAPRFVPKRRTVVDMEDVSKMSTVWDGYKFTELRNLLIVKMLFETGVRVSELVGLNLSDLSGTTALIPTRKTTSERIIMWSQDTQELLNRYLAIRLCLNNGNAIFVSLRSQERLGSRDVERIIRESCLKAGITKKITPHSFRHGKAHNMLKRGANVKEIASVLGHSETNPRASFQYLRLEQAELKNILQKYI